MCESQIAEGVCQCYNKEEKVNLTQEEKIRCIQELRPIDDIFFEVLMQNISVAQEILRTILEDDNLIVEDCITQASERFTDALFALTRSARYLTAQGAISKYNAPTMMITLDEYVLMLQVSL